MLPLSRKHEDGAEKLELGGGNELLGVFLVHAEVGKTRGGSGFSLDVPAWPLSCRMERAGGEDRRCPKVHEVRTEQFWSSQNSAITVGLEEGSFLCGRRRRSGLERTDLLPGSSNGITRGWRSLCEESRAG